MSAAAASLLARFATLHFVVWGDFIADEFLYGEITRVSREAPVLILKHRDRALVPGGGANTAANLAALGASVSLVGVIGDDAAGAELMRQFAALRMDISGLQRVRQRGTPTKTRILAGHAHTARQQVIRLDREPAPLEAPQQRRRLLAHAERLARRCHGLLLCDYGYGAVWPAGWQALRPTLPPGLPVTVDARAGVTAYAGVTAATPNEEEVEDLYHLPIGHDEIRLEDAGRRLLRELNSLGLLITRGRDGMALFLPGRPTLHIPICGQDQAVDVTGAGDTVLALFTAALAAGAHMETAARLANCAAGLVVMKRGTATLALDELAPAWEQIQRNYAE